MLPMSNTGHMVKLVWLIEKFNDGLGRRHYQSKHRVRMIFTMVFVTLAAFSSLILQMLYNPESIKAMEFIREQQHWYWWAPIAFACELFVL